MKYRKMNASTACPTPSGIGRPPMRTGAMAAGWIRSFSSRPACLTRSSVRNILTPRPGRAGAAHDARQEQHPVGREHRPLLIVLAGEAAGGRLGDDVEGC